MAEDKNKQEPSTLNLDKLGGFTQDDPEYWVLLAKIVGNPVTEIEDDIEEVDK